MRRRVVALTGFVAAIAMWASLGGVAAGPPQGLTINPDRILRGTTPTITIEAKTFKPEDVKSVYLLHEQLQWSKGDKKLTVEMPRLDMSGRASIEVFGNDNKLLAAGDVFYVDASEPNWGWSLAVTLFYVLLIVAFPWCLTLADVAKSYRAQRRMREQIIEKLGGNITVEHLRILLAQMEQGPPGISGLTRGAVALTLLLIIGIAVFHMVVLTPKVPDPVEKLLTLLAGAFTSITGFYFGSRAAEAGATAARAPVPPPPPPTGAVITGVTPSSGAPGAPVTLTGRGFGTSGTVSFADVPAVVPPGGWTDTSIKVTVPTVKAGTVKITVIPTGSRPAEIDFTVTEASASAALPTLTGKPNPEKAPPQTKIKLAGLFGQETGTVTFGTEPAPNVTWGEREIEVEVPQNLPKGAARITVKTKTGSVSVDFEVT